MNTVLNPHGPPVPARESTTWLFDDDKLKAAAVAYFSQAGYTPHPSPLVELIRFLHSDAARKLRVERRMS